MAERKETPMNELADAVLAKLKTISARKDNSFLTTPKVVKRVGVFGDFTGLPRRVFTRSLDRQRPVVRKLFSGAFSAIVARGGNG
jgi:hypothetical protein